MGARLGKTQTMVTKKKARRRRRKNVNPRSPDRELDATERALVKALAAAIVKQIRRPS